MRLEDLSLLSGGYTRFLKHKNIYIIYIYICTSVCIYAAPVVETSLVSAVGHGQKRITRELALIEGVISRIWV